MALEKTEIQPEGLEYKCMKLTGTWSEVFNELAMYKANNQQFKRLHTHSYVDNGISVYEVTIIKF